MRSKILASVIITVIFALLSATCLFIIIANDNEVNKTTEALENLNNYVKELNITDAKVIESYKINGVDVRCTFIDKNGKVIYDTYGKLEENHLSRIEVQEALKNGSGYSVRSSDTTRIKTVYYASLLNDGTILRTSIPFETVVFFNYDTMIYWIVILISVLGFSVFLSTKLVKTIVGPLKDLENVTARIANGDLHIRANQGTGGEIGSLARTFNNMADQLQNQINQVIDKQNRLESILSCMESGVIAVNRRDEVITINPYARRIFGIRKNITGENISSYIKDYDINNFLNGNEEAEKEIKLLHPIERVLRIKKATIVYDLEKIGKVIAVQDVTDIRRLENMRSQFVANVSHELKTPLTSIKGFAETLRYVEDDETRKKFLDIIDKESERLSRLINDILVLSKIESECIGEEKEFLPNGEIDDVMNMVKNFANSKNIKIKLEQTNSEMLYGDKDRFIQIVLNLVENGIKYSNTGATVIIRSFSAEGEYVLQVEDNGIGIPEDDIPRIFERFYRVDKARKSGGTGLGLAIVKHIVKTFNGEITVKSKSGVGSVFTVKIKHI
ncbi:MULTISPECIES: sensor histidine kinase [Clostridium]|uniref:histidine kinase n=1 Tax=Clostridium cibarium TaxID=2762247 RepID=A0ABR8PQC1_9CLOT|nr:MULTISPECIES: sensor histidine kinase [Clostridium]MBD7910379.1 HAMP domain-containing protein [Clostridium cibarium]